MKDKLKRRNLILQNIEKLDIKPKWKEMMEYRFGAIDNITHTLQETGGKWGLTRQRVEQIEKAVLAKIEEFKRLRTIN